MTNTGTLPGAAIGQVYVHAVASRFERVEMELAGFSKTTLQPGEKSTVTLHIDVRLSIEWSSSWADDLAQGILLLRCESELLDGRSRILRGPTCDVSCRYHCFNHYLCASRLELGREPRSCQALNLRSLHRVVLQ